MVFLTILNFYCKWNNLLNLYQKAIKSSQCKLRTLLETSLLTSTINCSSFTASQWVISVYTFSKKPLKGFETGALKYEAEREMRKRVWGYCVTDIQINFKSWVCTPWKEVEISGRWSFWDSKHKENKEDGEQPKYPREKTLAVGRKTCIFFFSFLSFQMNVP